ncbi:hypothetical protein PV08_06396 [Exophiala spinifera]|uniref:Required for respiratory growth protein 7, mitochondrial n=1 Tax=Exophiala spinifera TaxID=91928 RepID=A0A0D2BCJ3_9EURO|nr:uncharacterized protein PV08_06396 [Exophiala spinifera]KIW16345.1 hypothetical protein PV08_06396 [Exophiala spinifera]
MDSTSRSFYPYTPSHRRLLLTPSARYEKQDLKAHSGADHDDGSSTGTQHTGIKSSLPPESSSSNSLRAARSSSNSFTPPHSTLSTFLANAARTGLSPSSTVYTGTVYEYLAVSTLRGYGFHLHRVGGRGDRGVDLIGHWQVPLLSPTTGTWKEHTTPDGSVVTATDTFRVLVQCKRLVGKHARIGPNLIRELDGAVRGARLAPLFESIFPHGGAEPAAAAAAGGGGGDNDATATAQVSSNTPAIGILVGTRAATKGVIESMRRSNRALGWIMMEEEREDVAQALPVDDLADSLPSSSSSPVVDAAEDTPDPNSTSLNDSLNRARGVSWQGAEDPQFKPSKVSDTNADGDRYSDSGTNEAIGEDSTSMISAETSTSTKDSNDLAHPVKLRGRIRQILWNQAARNLGLEDVSVVPRYDSSGREEVVLMRGGRVWGGLVP